MRRTFACLVSSILLLGTVVVAHAARAAGTAPPPALEASLEKQGETNYKTKGGYFAGEGKWTEVTLPARPLPALIDRILPIVAEGGWEIANVSKDGGTISATQPIATHSGSAKVTLNVIANQTDDGNTRIQLMIKAPPESKVTDKEAKAVFSRILKAIQGASGSAPATTEGGATAKRAEKALRNDDVLSLVKVGLDDKLIISKIQGAEVTDFDLSTEGIVALKTAKVSNAVIDTMMKRAGK